MLGHIDKSAPCRISGKSTCWAQGEQCTYYLLGMGTSAVPWKASLQSSCINACKDKHLLFPPHASEANTCALVGPKLREMAWCVRSTDGAMPPFWILRGAGGLSGFASNFVHWPLTEPCSGLARLAMFIIKKTGDPRVHMHVCTSSNFTARIMTN
jgi:hypothetical protein